MLRVALPILTAGVTVGRGRMDVHTQLYCDEDHKTEEGRDYSPGRYTSILGLSLC